MRYIITNPLSPKSCQKLFKTCKYFYSTNPIIFIDWLEWDRLQRNFQTYSLNYVIIDVNNIAYKMWLTKQLRVRSVTHPTAVSQLLNKVFRCDLSHLCIFNQKISFNDYCILVNGGNIKHFEMENVEIRDENGNLVPLEIILEKLPNVVKCAFRFEALEEYNFSSGTSKKMAELPPFKYLGSFELYGIPLCHSTKYYQKK
uniref:Uncharacterized protein n=1 Tax=Panagrolaimus davidi TaxID=227884 RepID=A0A914QSM9_9BILA